jgi:hypothetical protein
MKSAVLAIVLLASAVPAFAVGMTTMPVMPTTRPAQLMPDNTSEEERARTKRQAELRDKLLALREEGLKLRDSDGGTLTAEHRAYLQAKLDDLNAEARAQQTP